MFDSKRRAFIAFVGGGLVAGPHAVLAQQPPRIAKVGLLYPGMALSYATRIAGLREGLQAAGFREPDDIELVPRAADGDPTRVAPLAVELAERNVDVIAAVSPPAVRAALKS